jgi:hypothetical protein
MNTSPGVPERGARSDRQERKAAPSEMNPAAETPRREWMDAAEAARYCRSSESNLAKRRVSGDSPPFAKIGTKLLYRRADLDDWLLPRVRRSTSDNGDHCA